MEVPEPSVTPQPTLRAKECQWGGSARPIPQSGGKSARHVIRTDRHVRTPVEVLPMYARFTEGTIDPMKRGQAEIIAASIFTAAWQQKGFRGESLRFPAKGDAALRCLGEFERGLRATQISRHYPERAANR